MCVQEGRGCRLIHTSVDAFFQKEELQALSIDAVTYIHTPHCAGFDEQLLFLRSEICSVDSFSEEVEQALIRGDCVFVGVTVLEGFLDGGPQKIRYLVGNSTTNRLPVCGDEKQLLFKISSNGVCSFCKSGHRVGPSAMDPVGTTARCQCGPETCTYVSYIVQEIEAYRSMV